MPATVTELFEGRTETVATTSTAEIHYHVSGAEDEDAVKTAILNGTDLYYAGLVRKSIEIAEHVIGEDWKVVVKYETPTPGDEEEGPVIPDSQFSFDTTGGTQHITNSLETVDSAGEVSEDLNGAIGFDEGTVAGCDITVPAYSFSETHYYTDGEIADVKAAIFSTTGKVNTDAFKEFEAGEVLFLGASGSRTGAKANDLWEITYKFAAKENRTAVVIGGLGAVDVDGWNHLWIQYAPAVDPGVNELIKTPIAVYVELVYESCAFSVLGLGGGKS